MFRDALVDIPLQVDIDSELGQVPKMESRRTYTVITTYDTYCDKLEQLPARAANVPLRCMYLKSP